MALCRQGSEPLQDWKISSGSTFRSHDYGHMKQVGSGNVLCRVHPKFNRGRKLGRAGKSQLCSVGVIVGLFFGLAGFTLLGNHYRYKGGQESSERREFFDNQGHSTDYSFHSTWAETNQNIRKQGNNEIHQWKDGRKHGHFLVHGSGSWASKVLGLGQGSTGSGQDSSSWDRDEEYEKDLEILNTEVRSALKPQNIGLGDKEDISEFGFNSGGKSEVLKGSMDESKGAINSKELDKDNRSTRMVSAEYFGNGSLYNEHGRDELKIYEAQYEADLKEEHGLRKRANGDGLFNPDYDANIGKDVAGNFSLIEGSNKQFSQIQNYKQVAVEDVYDGGIYNDDFFSEDDTSDIDHQRPHHVSWMQKDHDQDYDRKDIIETESNLHKGKWLDSKQKEHPENVVRKYFYEETASRKDHAQIYDNNKFSEAQSNFSLENSNNANLEERLESNHGKELTFFIPSSDQNNAVKEIHELSQNLSRREKLTNFSEIGTWKADIQKRNTNSSRSKRRKAPSLPCETGFLNSTEGLREPKENPKFAKFSLEYVQSEEKPDGVDIWEPRFAGHQSLDERENSFYARDQKLYCGFVKGPKGSLSTGFELYEEDAEFLRVCHVAVSSCVFGNSDNIRAPTRKKVSEISKKKVCFVMFVDEKTLETLSSEGQQPDENGHIGLWKVVLVKNVPYTDMRRTGKVPKFLAHRLFPSARYSIWIDSKMRLNSDPLLILEYFLWRGGFEYAISNHYDRHCVWEEVMQNKRLNKFNHTVIDEQFASYQADGLTKFNASDPNTLLPSYVPEGSFIVRAHTPMSNLFSCLWFNEVDRFTPRDQLSFAYTFLKLRRMNPERHLQLNMFKDCERRFLSKLFHHRMEKAPPFPRPSKE